MNPDQGTIILYQSEDGQAAVDVCLADDTVWLSQAQMVELFQRHQSVISRHINNVFKEGELQLESNMQKMHIANSDKPVAFYNLDVIISVGYRIKSQNGTRFRIWATSILKDHPFTDSNKRIGSFLFLLFLQHNGVLEQQEFSNQTLVALTLLTSGSDPTQKDVLIRLIINLLAGDQENTTYVQ